MPLLHVPATCGRTAAVRVALLPGAYQQPSDFEREGFAAAVRARALPIDLDFVAPSREHLLDRRGLECLRRDLIVPARAAGVRALWLGGISLGAFLALLYAEQWPEDLDGLCLIAPWLGNRALTGAIGRSGGLATWQPGTITADDEERRVWAFAQRWPRPGLGVYLGLGQQDRFAAAQSLFAEALPTDDCERVAGYHDWPVWRHLWSGFLDRCAAGRYPGIPC